MEKIKQGQTISTKKLLQLISDFSNQHTFVYNIITCSRYPPTYLKSIDINILKDSILYCVSQQIRAVMPEKETWEQQREAKQRLKTYCYEKSLDGKWKEQFHFDHSMVFITKLISKFYQQYFEGIKTCIKLESQIYVVLIYTLLGLSVCLKSYEMLERKYWKAKKQKNVRKTYSSRKTPQKNNILKRRDTKDNSVIKSSSSFNICKKSNGSECQMTPNEKKQFSDLLEFKKNLQGSLYVAPLPKMIVKKKSIDSFCKINSDIPIKQTFNQTLHNYPLRRQKQYQVKLAKKSMYSTQMSSSFISELNKRKVCLANYGKPFKISHRPPYHSNHMVIKLEDKNSQTLLRDIERNAEENKQNCKIENSEWHKMIRKMRQPGGSSGKINIELWSKFQKEHNRHSQKDLSSENTEVLYKNSNTKDGLRETSLCQSNIACNNVSQFKKTQKNIKIEDNQFKKIESHSKAMKEIQEEEEETQKNKTIYPSLNAKNLKTDKNIFESTCKQRKLKIEYSMFMMPAKSKLIF